MGPLQAHHGCISRLELRDGEPRRCSDLGLHRHRPLRCWGGEGEGRQVHIRGPSAARIQMPSRGKEVRQGESGWCADLRSAGALGPEEPEEPGRGRARETMFAMKDARWKQPLSKGCPRVSRTDTRKHVGVYAFALCNPPPVVSTHPRSPWNSEAGLPGRLSRGSSQRVQDLK